MKQQQELTKAQMRVAVAKDVKLRLKQGLITPHSIYFGTLDDACELGVDGKDTIAAFRKWIKPGCEVCGIGALFVSQVLKFNNFTIPRFGPYDDATEVDEPILRKKLSQLFTSNQLFLIEKAFEGTLPVVGRGDRGWGEQQKSYMMHQAFYDQDPSRKLLMAAIMDNIIANEGTFKP